MLDPVYREVWVEVYLFLHFIYLLKKRGSHAPNRGTWPTIQARALTGNQTDDLLVHRPALSPVSHTSQVRLLFRLLHGIY